MVNNVKSQDFRGAPRLIFFIRICELIDVIFPFSWANVNPICLAMKV